MGVLLIVILLSGCQLFEREDTKERQEVSEKNPYVINDSQLNIDWNHYNLPINMSQFGKNKIIHSTNKLIVVSSTGKTKFELTDYQQIFKITDNYLIYTKNENNQVMTKIIDNSGKELYSYGDSINVLYNTPQEIIFSVRDGESFKLVRINQVGEVTFEKGPFAIDVDNNPEEYYMFYNIQFNYVDDNHIIYYIKNNNLNTVYSINQDGHENWKIDFSKDLQQSYSITATKSSIYLYGELNSNFQSKYYLFRYNLNGQKIYEKEYNHIYYLQEDLDGNLYMITYDSYYSQFIIKFDSNGNELYRKQLSEWIHDGLKLFKNGNVIFTNKDNISKIDSNNQLTQLKEIEYIIPIFNSEIDKKDSLVAYVVNNEYRLLKLDEFGNIATDFKLGSLDELNPIHQFSDIHSAYDQFRYYLKETKDQGFIYSYILKNEVTTGANPQKVRFAKVDQFGNKVWETEQYFRLNDNRMEDIITLFETDDNSVFIHNKIYDGLYATDANILKIDSSGNKTYIPLDDQYAKFSATFTVTNNHDLIFIEDCLAYKMLLIKDEDNKTVIYEKVVAMSQDENKTVIYTIDENKEVHEVSILGTFKPIHED